MESTRAGSRPVKTPVAARNRDPVLQVLHEVLPAEGGVLEIASGTGEHVAHFDRSLKSRDPDWGVRDIDDLTALASANGLRFVRSVAMPANNQSLIFEMTP
jgi:hypothetical protein